MVIHPNGITALRALPLLAASLLLASANAAASEQLDIHYYPISGQTSQQLLMAMQENGPSGDDGTRFHGYTRWNVRWQYRTTSQGRRCRIQSIDTQVTGEITLPQWSDQQDAGEDLRSRWQRYSRILREHEEGHYQFALQAGADIRRELGSLSSDAGCDALGKQVNALGKSLIDLQRQREIAYDRDTQHGRRDGLEL
ncbi:DUF922 domain-containing protein [Stenotrophomonas sp. SY1]|uniref:DUF922 domain-containing protein n=1 Tax=Stenotrophomonas sp. SY1 TaxID=477235 RepID=UPI001E5B4B18|nr:DUF922 domain-containing Zn-dependent protease [Stenotrophomonas sp. SY1]